MSLLRTGGLSDTSKVWNRNWAEVGLENAFSFAAVRGIQASRAYYIAMVPVRTLERLFQFDEAELPTRLRAQRELNKARIPAIAMSGKWPASR